VPFLEWDVRVIESEKILSESSPSPHPAFQLLTELTIPHLADYCAVDLLKGAHGTQSAVRYTFSTRNPGKSDGRVLSYVPALTRQVLESRKCALVNDVKSEPELNSSLGSQCSGAVVMIPLTGKVSSFGVVTFFNAPFSTRQYSQWEVRQLWLLTQLTSIALERETYAVLMDHAIQEKEDLLAVVSHELKNPLAGLSLQINTIDKGLRALEKEGLPSRLSGLHGLISHAQTHIAKLTHLIDGLWEFSSFSHGSLKLNSNWLDLADLAADTVAALSREISGSGSHVDIDASLPVVGYWDRDRLALMLQNLLGNAVKFGCGKPIRVQIDVRGEYALVSVCDQGLGIPAEEQARIFGKFERGRGKDGEPGLGLGLFIADQIAKAHGGSIELESVVGAGATFTVFLPISMNMQKH
jgi:signal transduction histidine kinase